MSKKIKYIQLLVIPFLLAQCVSQYTGPSPIRKSDIPAFDKPIPNRDIVFQVDSLYIDEDFIGQLGFINADGSGETYLIAKEFAPGFIEPSLSDDGKMLLYYQREFTVGGIDADGYLNTYRNAGYVMYRPSPIHGTDEFLTESGDESGWIIKRTQITTGEVLEKYPVGKKPDGSEYIGELGTNNLIANELLFGRWFVDEDDVLYIELVIRNISTGNERILLQYNGDLESVTRIMKPAFSPDGSWIAYTSNDGIYLIRPDGSDNHQIIKKKCTKYIDWPPAASWSPDGEWIVYHLAQICSYPGARDQSKDSNIFKYNLETGEEVLLVQGGLNPYWHWPVVFEE
jgi:hypothetical protein